MDKLEWILWRRYVVEGGRVERRVTKFNRAEEVAHGPYTFVLCHHEVPFHKPLTSRSPRVWPQLLEPEVQLRHGIYAGKTKPAHLAISSVKPTMSSTKAALKSAKAALDGQKYEEAIQRAQTVLSLDPKNYFAYISQFCSYFVRLN